MVSLIIGVGPGTTLAAVLESESARVGYHPLHGAKAAIRPVACVNVGNTGNTGHQAT